MAGDFLSVGVSGLMTSQSAINTTSHNIANAGTEGYHRQVTEINSRLPQFLGSNYVGTGAEIANIKRIFDSSIARELQVNLSTLSELNIYLDQASRVDNLIADSSTGLNSALQNFFASVQTVSDEPSSVPSRQVLLSQSELLVTRFNNLAQQLTEQRRSLNIGIESAAQTISTLGQNIAELNVRITSAQGGIGTSGQPNDLLDQRDKLVNDLAELIDIQTINNDDGSMSVFIGSGQALVIGAQSSRLVPVARVDDPVNYDIELQSGSSAVNVTSLLTGGELGGFLKFQGEILEPALNLIGRVSLSIADSFNQQHQLGMDSNNNLGGLFFTDINDVSVMAQRVNTSSVNTGTASISLQIDDTNLLTDANYSLNFDGANYSVTNQVTNTVVATFPAPGATPATVSVPTEGISIVFNSGAANAGDRFLLLPTRNEAFQMDLAINDVSQIASALPVKLNSNINNTGTGSIGTVSVTDTTTPQFTNIPNNLDPPLLFEFISPTSFNVRNANTNALVTGPVAGFVPNQENDMLALAGLNYGYDVSIGGAPQTNDTFTATYNTDGIGDNRNMLALGSLQQASIMDNGTSNFQQAFGRLVGDVGTRTQEAKINQSASESLVNQVKNRRESMSGVNLDEEAANLIRFEQAYQAAAQIIQVARTIFQTIIDSTR